MRERSRRELARKVCALPYSRLYEWGISRVAAIEGLDVINIPVYTACRPPGKVITISTGKGITKTDAMAGAILEGVELWASEHPERFSEWEYCSYNTLVESFTNVMPFELMPFARDAPVNRDTLLAFEEMTDIFRQRSILVPSDMIWMKPRKKTPFIHFQTSTSGLAAGVNVQDAILQATLELIERDGWAISEFVEEHTGQWSECISMDGGLHPDLQFCMDRLYASSVTPFLFDLTTDIDVPIFRCNILDESDSSPGCFSGVGCSLDPVTAARRAITEACQSRAAYISGARDDLFRRRFILMKNLDMSALMGMYKSRPQKRNISSYGEVQFESIDQEWSALETKIKDAGIKEVYSKTIYTCADPSFSIVKVIMPELECPLWGCRSSGKRATESLKNLR